MTGKRTNVSRNRKASAAKRILKDRCGQTSSISGQIANEFGANARRQREAGEWCDGAIAGHLTRAIDMNDSLVGTTEVRSALPASEFESSMRDPRRPKGERSTAPTTLLSALGTGDLRSWQPPSHLRASGAVCGGERSLSRAAAACYQSRRSRLFPGQRMSRVGGDGVEQEAACGWGQACALWRPDRRV